MLFAVFFPSLMGFGILISGALLVSDAVQKLLPHEGRRRRRRVAVGAYGVVARTAQAAGRSVPEAGFLRRSLRPRSQYLGVALLSLGATWLIVVAGAEAYDDVKGVFYSSPWIAGLAIGFAIALGLLAVMALVMALLHRPLPRGVGWVVERTIVGRLRIPEADVAITAVLREEE